MKDEFYPPVKHFYVGQSFGENTVCVNLIDKEEYIPCDGWNPPIGYKSVYGPNGHLGIDVPLQTWYPIVASREGEVVFIDKNEKTGYDVRIKTVIDGDEHIHIYEHMVKWKVKVGQEVKTGQLIGWVGTTGLSTGPHLHFEIWKNGVPIDPMSVLNTTIYAGDILKLNNKIQYAWDQIAVIQRTIATKYIKG